MKIPCKRQYLNRSAVIGIIATLALGSLLHFTYEWSGRFLPVSFFSAVNESTWEHLKLLFMPMFLYSALESTVLEPCFPGLLKSRALGCLLGMFVITSFFYTYSGILGTNYLVLDLLSFFLGTAAAFGLSSLWIQRPKKASPFGKTSFYTGLAVFIILFLCFAVFTWYPPKLGLFQEP